MQLHIEKVTGIPAGMENEKLVDAMMGRQFMLCHDLAGRELFLVSDSGAGMLKSALPGLESEDARPQHTQGANATCIVAMPVGERNRLDSIYGMLGGMGTQVVVSFAPMAREDVERARRSIEEMLSGMETAVTESTSSRADASSESASRHRDSYHGSDEKDVLLSSLASMKSMSLTSGTAYKVLLFVTGEKEAAEAYIRSRLLVLSTRNVNAKEIEDLWMLAKRLDALPCDSMLAARMFCMPNTVRSNVTIRSQAPVHGEITLGNYMDASASATDEPVGTSASSLNLGTLITGVPGTGKSVAAMHIAMQVKQKPDVGVAVLSPTDEWNHFGRENGMEVITLYDSRTHFNFFKCDSSIGIEGFYESLAMLLASASEAGPYTSSLEKCLLPAFRRSYEKLRDPDPLDVYDCIEDAVLEQHGKKTGAGTVYTKHGENVRSALANLRAMLNRPEFSKRQGVDMKELLKRGVIFDLSKVSSKMRPFFYALILNQVYSVAEELDTEGDMELRMLACIEEAQLVFEAKYGSAATLDLLQRIQDFRKRGVGLVLVTHGPTDIAQEVRRMLQTKLYFRQSADIAKLAANDLAFGEEDKDALIEKLKGLQQRVCALDYITDERGERGHAGSVFIRIPESAKEPAQEQEPKEQAGEDYGRGEMVVKVMDRDGKPKQGQRLRLYYVSEVLYQGVTDEEGTARVDRTITGNRYRLVVLGEKKKDNREFAVRGGELNIVET